MWWPMVEPMLRICKYCGKTFEGDPGASACSDCASERKTNVIRQRVCQTCGTVFDGGPRAWYCPTCREERRRQHDREYKQRKKAGQTRKIGSTAYCEVCGQPFIVNGGLQRYCPQCAPETIRHKANALSRAWNEANVTPEQRKTERHQHTATIPCVICGKLFVPSSPARTCSPACSDALSRRNRADYETKNRVARNEYHRKRLADKLAAMTEAERQAYRDKINARARENYKKRKERGE